MKSSSAKTLTPGEGCADLRPPPGIRKHVAGETRPCLWIRTAAGPSIGFGHLMRSLVLARLLEDSVESVFLLDGLDVQSRSQVTALGWRCKQLSPGVLSAAGCPPDCVLIDTRQTEGTALLLLEARGRGIPVVSIHDLGLNPLASDIAIDGSIAPSRGGFPGSGRVYTGTRYLVLDPVYGRLRRQPKRISARIEALVVNLGGGDSGGAFVKVLEGLRLWGHRVEVVGVPGFSRWGQNELTRRDWGSVRFRWAMTGEAVADLVFGADLAVTAGGLAAFEALCVGTPAMALSVDAFQQTTISTLANKEACVDLGLAMDFDPAQLPRSIAPFDTDRSRRRRLSFNGRRIVDGHGAQRVAHIVSRCILEHAGRVVAGSMS